MMFKGYMSLGNTEVINNLRAYTYIKDEAPTLKINPCHVGAGMYREFLFGESSLQVSGGSPFDNPIVDAAPWYVPNRPRTGDFLGLYCIDVQGMEDSTQTVEPIDISTGGAVIPPGFHKRREIRFVCLATATSEEGLVEGMTWLRTVMDSHQCSLNLECSGRTMGFFAAEPSNTVGTFINNAVEQARVMYRVEALDPPTVTKIYPSKALHMIRVEFTLVAGLPWRFTYPTTLAQVGGSTGNTVAHVDYPIEEATLITDPTYGTVMAPPRPPVFSPTSNPTPATWYRYSMEIEEWHTERWGKAIPKVLVSAGTTAKRNVRIRFYPNPGDLAPSAVDGPGWDGEFLVTYVPALHILTIDAVLENITIHNVNDPDLKMPGGHLVAGTSGRPFSWPSLLCKEPYVVHVDSQVVLGNGSVVLALSTRE